MIKDAFFLTAFADLNDNHEEGNCFEQEYTNAVVDLRSLHTIQRVAIVSPYASAYYLSAWILADSATAAADDEQETTLFLVVLK